tara:strand:- start:1446 stop:1868 length:423 start_codon:yes stop_codon:yes gene_type:complete
MAHERPVSDPDGLGAERARRLETATVAKLLLNAWAESEPDHPVTKHPASYAETFTDMAKAMMPLMAAPDEREIAALREDAERYRFWREVLAGDDKAAMDLFEEELNRDVAIGNRPPTGEELDKAVDVARRLRAGKEGEPS